jgi:hypothetical protein
MYNNISYLFYKPQYEVAVVIPMHKSSMNQYKRYFLIGVLQHKVIMI